MALVDKDKLVAVAQLRAEVSKEKDELLERVRTLEARLAHSTQTEAMQLSQINALLLDKIKLQNDGLAHKDQMLARR